MRDFKQLKVWQRAHRLVLDVHEHSRAQLRRAAASVVSNIAEGSGREGERELARYLSIAAGSASEVELTANS